MKKVPEKVTLTLSRSDRDLIRRHGYPFPAIQAVLDAVPESVDEAVVPCDGYSIERLLGDLAISINECTDPGLQDRLDELCESIEWEAGI
ncbi:MAG: hypothetical protein ACE5H3_12295 [Planctomycetota bacterium]